MTNLAEEHGSRQTGLALEQKLRAHILIANWEWHGPFETSQPPLVTGLLQHYLRILPKQSHQLVTKSLNTESRPHANDLIQQQGIPHTS